MISSVSDDQRLETDPSVVIILGAAVLPLGMCDEFGQTGGLVARDDQDAGLAGIGVQFSGQYVGAKLSKLWFEPTGLHLFGDVHHHVLWRTEVARRITSRLAGTHH